MGIYFTLTVLSNEVASLLVINRMNSMKLRSGGTIPAITLPLLGGGRVTLGQRRYPENWQVIFVYRGLHCPLCKRYLGKLKTLKEGFEAAGAELLAISGDPEERAQAMIEETGLDIPVAYDLSIEQMQELGLYISNPRSPEETDRPFAEPAMYAINEKGLIHLIDLSNTPFNRSDLDELLDTVEWVRANNYPIRGTYCEGTA
ncbi:alkyl hydroperoxide reductase/ Thiol specific antioxidant/ Mal allergen [Coraliomargarita akajimensis DSM 45221]|uniref:Alkyl hydroperoxide reductase/ Thiol specific antioxidant/ Mal allergen n=2 Tax=Coraliomargarita TaxID=442430 RepID=D5EQJ1_CORAD|nr:alkyl hydroperoxide reductase/ Thiol specific antioxidant/ Mal allergen [Coraliomargarita akajimensis DSM 45221]